MSVDEAKTLLRAVDHSELALAARESVPTPARQVLMGALCMLLREQPCFENGRQLLARPEVLLERLGRLEPEAVSNKLKLALAALLTTRRFLSMNDTKERRMGKPMADVFRFIIALISTSEMPAKRIP